MQKRKLCGCPKNKIPGYGFPGFPVTCCQSCQVEGMVCAAKKCVICNIKQPCYNYPGQPPRFCKSCIPDEGMVDVRSLRCTVCNVKQRSHAMPEGKPTHCASCASDGMVDMKGQLCVPCRENGIYVRASFGFTGQKKIACAGCRVDGMVDISNKRCAECLAEGKQVQPSLGYPGKPAVACSKHAEDGMVSLSTYSSQCERCERPERRQRLKVGLCYTCRCGDLRAELRVREFLTHKFPEIQWTFDKSSQKIVQACGRHHRPDIFADMGSYNLIVEVDEGQHADAWKYPLNDEVKRMKALRDACRPKPLLMLRHNPDDDYQIDGVKQDIHEAARLAILADKIRSSCCPVDLRVEYLFYNPSRVQVLEEALSRILSF